MMGRDRRADPPSSLTLPTSLTLLRAGLEGGASLVRDDAASNDTICPLSGETGMALGSPAICGDQAPAARTTQSEFSSAPLSSCTAAERGVTSIRVARVFSRRWIVASADTAIRS